MSLNTFLVSHERRKKKFDDVRLGDAQPLRWVRSDDLTVLSCETELSRRIGARALVIII